MPPLLIWMCGKVETWWSRKNTVFNVPIKPLLKKFRLKHWFLDIVTLPCLSCGGQQTLNCRTESYEMGLWTIKKLNKVWIIWSSGFFQCSIQHWPWNRFVTNKSLTTDFTYPVRRKKSRIFSVKGNNYM